MQKKFVNKNNLNQFIENDFNKILQVVSQCRTQKNELIKFYNTLIKLNKKNRVHIFGNGGSASIASHFSMDLTNNSKIKCLSYNDASIITCFANDFKFENWIKRSVEKFGEKEDVLILISSSGKSQNMINAIKAARQKKFYKVITLTGFEKNNPLKKLGHINLHIDSKNYNHIESTHQIMLLSIVDMVKKFSKK